MPRARKYPKELLERGVRIALESGRPVAQVARDLGIGSEVVRKRVRRAEADQGKSTDLLTSAEREEIRKLRKENDELRKANEILQSASVFFARELDTDPEVSAFIDQRREDFGVEPICRTFGRVGVRVLPPGDGASALSGLWRTSGWPGGSARRTSATTTRTGHRRMWKALERAGEPVARCQVRRLMACHGIQGQAPREAVADDQGSPGRAQKPDLVQRDFTAARPNALWVRDFTYLRCWEGVL